MGDPASGSEEEQDPVAQKAVYGKPIHAFQREYKMQAATKLLISTSLSITEIAGRLGYENPNKFSTSFKEIIGQSPSEYRKQRK